MGTIATEPVYDSGLTYEGSTTISSGGTHTERLFRINAPGSFCVQVTTTSPVVFDRCIFVMGVDGTSTGDNGYAAWLTAGGNDVEFKNCQFFALNAMGSGKYNNRAIQALFCKRLKVHHCYFSQFYQTILIHDPTGDGTASQRGEVLYNQFRNANGTPGEFAHHIQCNIGGWPGIDIAWNEFIETPGVSYNSDIVNFNNFRATSGNRGAVRNNYFYGSFSANPNTDVIFSGTAFLFEGEGNTGTHYMDGHDNVIVGSQNVGAGIYAGSNNHLYNNLIVTSGLYNGGLTTVKYNNVGMYCYDGATDPEWDNNYVDTSNVIGFMKDVQTSPIRSDTYTAGCEHALHGGGTVDPDDHRTSLHAGTITWQDELDARATWETSVANDLAADVVIGIESLAEFGNPTRNRKIRFKGTGFRK